MIEPGATIGILGGGQLGRMTAMAAARLGYRCHIFAPDEDCIAAAVADDWTNASYGDRDALARFARRVDVITIEFENVPADALLFLAERVPTRPAATVLEVTQDRLVEKRTIDRFGVPVAPFLAVDGPADLEAARVRLGEKGILKTRRLGYDGKGQVRIEGMTAEAAWNAIGGSPAILEACMPFVHELSVITARSPSGQIASFPPVLNIHRDQILRQTRVPGGFEAGVARRAVELAERIAEGLQLEGLVAVEMFLMEGGALAVNELAPRPHNSGHWTIDACQTSQFEQLVRAICDLPLGGTSATHVVVMDNLIGDDLLAWPGILEEPDAVLHIYGKAAIRPGRKMGHVTRLSPLAPCPVS
ncbi:MAG: 5-(carboxyamino)imidazole ribonucleotide synthase [Geminicoccaceae bacterium]|nr:5-(carboxyamino)imidazole ribonucleotide synthase [Geminicoccaceae bacterium]